MADTEKKSYIFHAYHVYETFKLKELDKLFRSDAISKSSTRLVFQDDERSYFFIYRFGSIIFFNVEAKRRDAIIDKLRELLGHMSDVLISEDFTVELSDDDTISVGFEGACIDGLFMDRIELLALILAQSTALEYFENRVDDLLGKTADIGHSLQKRGRLQKRESEIKRFMGQCITTKQDLVASLYLLDKPDETWDDHVLDKLYRGAVEMFELHERYKTVDYKLKMIQENLELIAELLQYRHANFLEWAIILLIAVEIVLFVMQLFILEG